MNEQDQDDTLKYGLNGTVEGQWQFSQAPSPFAETRSMLKKLAMKEGAHTPAGHGASNMLELTENLAKGVDGDQARQIAASLERQKTRLDGVLSQPR